MSSITKISSVILALQLAAKLQNGDSNSLLT